MKKSLPLSILVIFICLLIPIRSNGQEDGLRRGFQLLRARQFEEAVTAFTRAIEYEPDNAEAYNHRGVAWAYMGKIDRAISDYTQALEIKPELVGALNNRGSAFYQKGLLNQAISDYSKAIEINPYLAEAYSNRGTAWAAKGDYFRAIRDYTQALETNPYFDAPYYNRGRALSAIGDYGQAVGDIERAIELNPKFHAAYDLLAKIYAECPDPEIKNPAKAVTFAGKAVELNPNPEYLGTLAVALTEAGNFDQAVLTQQRALEMLRQQGKTDAIAAYEKGLEAILERKRETPKAKPASSEEKKKKLAKEESAEKKPEATASPATASTTLNKPHEPKEAARNKEIQEKKPAPKESMKKETMVSSKKPSPSKKYYTIQAGAFLSKEYADERNRYLLDKGYDARVVQFSDRKGRIWHTVRIGRHGDLKTARQTAEAIATKEKIKTSVRPGGSL